MDQLKWLQPDLLSELTNNDRRFDVDNFLVSGRRGWFAHWGCDGNDFRRGRLDRLNHRFGRLR
jgi:hypothetical protein